MKKRSPGVTYPMWFDAQDGVWRRYRGSGLWLNTAPGVSKTPDIAQMHTRAWLNSCMLILRSTMLRYGSQILEVTIPHLYTIMTSLLVHHSGEFPPTLPIRSSKMLPKFLAWSISGPKASRFFFWEILYFWQYPLYSLSTRWCGARVWIEVRCFLKSEERKQKIEVEYNSKSRATADAWGNELQ